MGLGIEERAGNFFRHIYLEFAGKLDYARYSNLKIYKGEASHAFGTAEIILNLGYTFGKGTRSDFLFTAEKRELENAEISLAKYVVIRACRRAP
jgi:hypothetical protein